MEDKYIYLFSLAVILLSTKVLGLASRRVHMPAVVGALISGVILGPSFLDMIEYSDFIQKGSEIGVILLMFLCGLETDMEELKHSGVASFIVALVGVVVPLLGGFFCYRFMMADLYAVEPLGFLRALFVGVTLTATSVSITVETLREMGKLNGKVGTTILGAAIIDDIVGIIVLTTITSMQDTDVNPIMVLVKILLFFIVVAMAAAGVIFAKRLIKHVPRKRRTSIYALGFCFLMSYIAEAFFGVADITGAYFAGLMFCNFSIREYIDDKLTVLSFLFFGPLFFASIGIQTNLHSLNSEIMAFTVVLLIVAILSKIVGCGLGARLCKFNNKEAFTIGVGMVSRGEVALIVAQKGADCGLLSEKLFPAIVVVVIITTLLTPILLKFCLTDKPQAEKLTA